MNFRSSELFELIQFKSIRKLIKATVCLGPNLAHCSTWLMNRGAEEGSPHGTRRRRSPHSCGRRREVVGERAEEDAHVYGIPFWRLEWEEAHRRGCSMVVQSGSGGTTTIGQRTDGGAGEVVSELARRQSHHVGLSGPRKTTSYQSRCRLDQT
jgi:hypothetical protein